MKTQITEANSQVETMENLFDSEVSRLSKKMIKQQTMATRELLKLKFRTSIEIKKLEIEKSQLEKASEEKADNFWASSPNLKY